MITASSHMCVVHDHSLPQVDVDIVVPVYNEEKDIVICVERLVDFVSTQVPYTCRITLADNASTDTTLREAVQLAERFPDRVRVVHLEKKGRGRALNAVWSTSDARVCAYMDVDLSTNLNAFVPLVAPLLSGHSDVAIGSRLLPGSRVVRAPKREFISRSYNRILRVFMSAHFSDAQCGFKAITTRAAAQLLPHVYDTGWFFDTELLVLSQRVGLRVHEIAVDWIDDPHSKVDIISTATEDLKGCWRVRKSLWRKEIPVKQLQDTIGRPAYRQGVYSGVVHQLLRFALVGVLSTVLYLVLFILARQSLNVQAANFVALALSAVFNVCANRAFTFQIKGSKKASTHYGQGMIVFVITAAITSGALALLNWKYPHRSTYVEVGVLTVANLLATVLRFVAYRWIFTIRHPVEAIENVMVQPELEQAPRSEYKRELSEKKDTSQRVPLGSGDTSAGADNLSCSR